MKKITRTAKVFMALCSILAINYSCTKENVEKLLEEDQENIVTQTEVIAVLQGDAISGLTNTMLTNVFATNLESGKYDNTNKEADCFETTFTNTGYTATFANCTVDGTDNINGTIGVSFKLENGIPVYTAVYSNFMVGNISIQGTKDVVVTSMPNDTEISLAVVSDMTIVLEDGTVVIEKGNKTLALVQGASLETSTIEVTGDWLVQIAQDTYAVSVEEVLGGNLACDDFTSGIMAIAKNGLTVDVNFGDGTCDNLATLIYPNGVEATITLED